MSNNGVEVSKQMSPTGSRHQVNRSITDVSGGKLHRNQHYHHYPHIHRKDRDKDDKVPQSAHPNLQPNGFAEGIKSEGITPDQSRNASRRASIRPEGADGLFGSNERREVREGEVKEEREKGVQRATELRNVLTGLNTLSNNTTRKLDNTYYSVLEKLSMLQNTIQNLKELATMAKQVNGDFKTESEDIAKDVETQLDAFGGFEEQQKKIESLDERVQKGREKIKILSQRVDVVKERVEDWEREELEWQERTRKRLRMLWIVMSVCAAVLIAVVLFQYTPARTQSPGVLRGTNTSLPGKIPDLEDIQNGTWNLKRRPTMDVQDELRNKTKDEKATEEDPRLRMFDEL